MKIRLAMTTKRKPNCNKTKHLKRETSQDDSDGYDPENTSFSKSFKMGQVRRVEVSAAASIYSFIKFS